MKTKALVKNYKILIVDDTKHILSTLKETLEHFGYQIDTTDNGLEAYLKASKVDYNLILLDIKLPKMDGLEAFEKIKVIKPGIPIIFISGLGHSNGGKQFIDMGAFDYLSKPLDLARLLDVVKKGLGQYKTI